MSGVVVMLGCQQSNYLDAHESYDWRHEVSSDVRTAWQEHHSYYALIEIIDTELPLRGNQIEYNPTRADVEAALGKGGRDLHHLEWEDIDTCPIWEYHSRRKVNAGSFVAFYFDDQNRVTHMDWYSE